MSAFPEHPQQSTAEDDGGKDPKTEHLEAHPGTLSKTHDVFDSKHPMYVQLTVGHVMRLLELAPGTPDDPIVTRLSICELEHAPQYEAVSYVWGDPNNKTPIRCNGKWLNITMNLHGAFKRIRLKDQPRIVWADAICINQGDDKEKSHHVAFMSMVYRQARRVLVCIGKDPDGGARNVVDLVNDHTKRMKSYKSIKEMPVLADGNLLFDDPRWKYLATLMKNVWFTRVWVIQEVGVAVDPVVLYGDVEFSYRDLMGLARWIVRCASQLETRASIWLETIHTDWEYWSEGWQEKQDYDYALTDLLSAGKALGCKDPRDHVYAFLGHALTQKDDGSPMIMPDYEKSTAEVYCQLSEWMIKEFGPKVLSAVEHDHESFAEDVPSWTVRWNMHIIQNSMGYYSPFYYCASRDERHDLRMVGNTLLIQGLSVDIVRKVYQFSKDEKDWPVCKALEALQKGDKFNDTLGSIWNDNFANRDPGSLDEFSLTLCAGLTNYECAEDDLEQHRANFAAFWALRENVLSSRAGQASEEAADKFWYDLSLSCKGRSFFVTQKYSYCGLGPWILKPSDECYILRGARVPFTLRKDANDFKTHKVVGEAYVHGIMRGELLDNRVGGIEWADLTVA